MDGGGWIKLHRALMDKPIWTCATVEQRSILITILMLANHAEKQWEWKGQRFVCKPGQLVTSLHSLAKASKCSLQNVRTALKRFENLEFLTDESTNTGRLITIVNWDKYQGCPDELTGELTGSQQAPNRHLTANKNDKNERMKERDIYTPEFETWYSSWPRPEAKRDSYRNFERIRKDKGLDFIWQCTKNYLSYRQSIPERERGPDYSSRNFFGQKAYYEDFIQPKLFVVKNGDTARTINGHRF